MAAGRGEDARACLHLAMCIIELDLEEDNGMDHATLLSQVRYPVQAAALSWLQHAATAGTASTAGFCYRTGTSCCNLACSRCSQSCVELPTLDRRCAKIIVWMGLNQCMCMYCKLIASMVSLRSMPLLSSFLGVASH
jgi:hypothetical protein